MNYTAIMITVDLDLAFLWQEKCHYHSV